MIIRHLGKTPRIHPSAYVAPSATICGDVSIAEGTCVLSGCSVIAEGGSIEIGRHCIVLENAVLRSTARFPLTMEDHCLVGPNAHVVGCTIQACVFIATGAAVFHGAVLGTRSEVRINGIVHLRSHLPPDETVPIGWVAVGNPAEILPPNEHERIWAIQQALNFPKSVYGVDRAPEGGTAMPEITRRLSQIYQSHLDDVILDREV